MNPLLLTPMELGSPRLALVLLPSALVSSGGCGEAEAGADGVEGVEGGASSGGAQSGRAGQATAGGTDDGGAPSASGGNGVTGGADDGGAPSAGSGAESGAGEAGAPAGGAGPFPCTEQGIRDAIAVGDGPHTFTCNGPTTVITRAEIVIDRNVTLDGEGDLTLDGDGDHALFEVAEDVTTELAGFTITNGTRGVENAGALTLRGSTISGNGASNADRDGAGIFNTGSLILEGSAVTENTTSGNGAGLYNDGGVVTIRESAISGNRGEDNALSSGGGIYNAGTLDLERSTVSDNYAWDSAGGIFNQGGEVTITDSVVSGNQAGEFSTGGLYSEGGVVDILGSLFSENEGPRSGAIHAENVDRVTIVGSTIAGNLAYEGAGDAFAGGIVSSGNVTLYASTVAANTGVVGGGIYNGPTFDEAANLTIINSTLSTNEASSSGGGLFNAETGVITLISSTLSGNTAPNADAIFNEGELTLSNSLVDGSCGGPASPTTGDYNLESPGNTCRLDGANDLFDVLPEELLLDPLGDNGGPTETQALASGSVAIDRIPEAQCRDDEGGPLTEDQRGEPRPGGQVPSCDAGAFEAQP